MANIINPLQAIIDQAAKNLPVETGRFEQSQQRLEYSNTGTATVLALDYSSSMLEKTSTGERKHEVLEYYVQRLQLHYDICLAFADKTTAIVVPNFPQASGSTAMEGVFQHVVKKKIAVKTLLLVSDGHPNNPQRTLDAAAKMRTGIINTLFVGNESDKEGIAFLRKLARLGAGRAMNIDIAQNAHGLEEATRTLLLST